MAKLHDHTLIQMALSDSGEHFDKLMRRHMTFVRRRVSAMIRNPSDVDDVVQEVFFKAWRALPAFRADSTLRTWLHTIATNEALIFSRREHRRRLYETPGDVDNLASNSEPADQAVMRGEATRRVHGAVLRLPLKYREAVVLRDLEELGADVAAERLKLSVPAVKTRQYRGRQKLAATLRRSPEPALRAA